MSIEILYPAFGTDAWKISLFLYCNFVVNIYRNTTDHFIKNLATCILGGFGGSLIIPSLLGLTTPVVSNSMLLGTMIFVWVLQVNVYFGGLYRSLISQRIAEYIIAVGFEVFRNWAMFSWYDKAVSMSDGIIGPIAIGTLGGCGSMFLPFSKGLTVLENGAPMGMETSFYNIVTYHWLSKTMELDQQRICEVRMFLCIHLILIRVFPSLDAIYRPMRYTLKCLVGIPPSEKPKEA